MLAHGPKMSVSDAKNQVWLSHMHLQEACIQMTRKACTCAGHVIPDSSASYLTPPYLLINHVCIQLSRQPLHPGVEHAVSTGLSFLLVPQVRKDGDDDR